MFSLKVSRKISMGWGGDRKVNKFEDINVAESLFTMGVGEFRVSLHPIWLAQMSPSIYF